MNTLDLQQSPNGQWQYRILRDDGTVAVSWQFGSFDRAETVRQAQDRFGPLAMFPSR